MSYALENIENFILYTINPGQNNQKKFTVEEYNEHCEFVNFEIYSCRSKMQKDYFSREKEQSLSFYIHTHQDRIILLANQLLNYAKNPKAKANKSFFEEILLKLEDFLSYMESFFVKHFNLFAALPANYKTIVVQEIELKLAVLKAKGSEFNIDPELIYVVSSPIESYISDHRQKKLTYGLKILFTELLNDCHDLFINHHLITNQAIIQILHDINFNHLLFLSYLSTLISLELNNIHSKEQKLLCLDYHIVQTENIIIHKPEFIFYPKVPSTKDSLLSWLNGKKVLIERSTINEFTTPEKVIRRASPFKILFNVNQISYILRKICESKLSGSLNYSELAEVFAAIFSTKNTDNISFESLRTKYVSITPKEIRQIKESFLKIINQMNSDLTRISKK